jgi:hypothetical protein
MPLRESELESEFEDELEGEYEYEAEDEGEEFLGGLGNIVSGLIGQGEGEYEDEYELEGEYEDEAEEFFGRIGRWVKRNSRLLKRIAKVAAPLVGTALGARSEARSAGWPPVRSAKVSTKTRPSTRTRPRPSTSRNSRPSSRQKPPTR